MERAFAFGVFQLFPAQRTLLEDGKPVRLGSRALDLLVELVTHASQIISKEDLISRVWSEVFVDEGSLRVHISALRRALGDDRAPHRYIVNVPTRGYCFVAQVASSAARTEVAVPPDEYRYGLPVALTRMIGRSAIVASLIADLPRHRSITIVGPGGIGKTRVALAVAEAVAPSYPDGARFVDFSRIGDARLVPSAVASALGLSNIASDPTANIIAFVRNKHQLLIFDSCEHVLAEAAALAERVLQHAAGVHILATSREPLKLQGERLRRLPTLAAPPASSEIDAEAALAFPAVELFVERAAAVLDVFVLDDMDAPVVARICRKLAGIPLAIELVAGRVEALGIPGLAKMLEDGFELFAEGGGATVARHRTMSDTLEWSYKWLSEAERAMLCRLGIFAGAFGIDAVRAVVVDVETRAPIIAERLASLVSKSLVSADAVGPEIAYRLLDTTRAHALEKLAKTGDLDAAACRHALYHRDMMEQAEKEWRSGSLVDWIERYEHRLDDVRAALRWAYSPKGDPKAGIALTIAALPLWYQLALMAEYRDYVNQALASRVFEPSQEMKLLEALGLTVICDRLPETDEIWTRALLLAQEHGDHLYQLFSLWGLCAYYSFKSDFHNALKFAEKSRAVALACGRDDFAVAAEAIRGIHFRYLGDYGNARRYLNYGVQRPMDSDQSAGLGNRLAARAELSNVLWIQGFPDQAMRNLEVASGHVRATRSSALLCLILANATCPLALFQGDWAMADISVRELVELSGQNGLVPWSYQARCMQGALLLTRKDPSGLTHLRIGIGQLREARFGDYYTALYLCYLAKGLLSFGENAEAHAAIDEAIQQADRLEEHWITPELLRIKGEVLRQDSSATDSAEAYFLQSLDWARRQDALSWELRAATSLAGLWRQNGNIARALELLSAVYGRFTEGFETGDLITARNLLDRLRTGQS